MIGHLLNQTLTYAPVSGRSSGGQATYGSQVSVACRWEDASTKVTNAEGEERVGSHVAITEAEVPTNARVWGPGDDTTDNNEAHRIIGRRKAPTPDGRWIYETVL